MSRKAWAITIFWVVALSLCAWSFYDYDHQMDVAKQPEQHWFPPSMTTPSAPPPANAADLRMIRYIVHATPGAMNFTADIVVKNFGLKKATDIQVRVTPYHGLEINTSQPAPDEMENPNAPDAMATTYQWVEFPDLGPGETSTQTITLLVRNDAEPRTRFEPKITFATAKDNP